jgi:hypothetical protein
MQESFSNLRLLLAADSFERSTRLYVAIMVLLPMITLFGVSYPIDFKYIPVFVGLFAICGGSWVLGQFVQSLGQRKQEFLRLRWGGRPAILLMRHQDPTVAAFIKKAWHQKYAAHLNVPFPTAAEERRQPAHADATYAQAASWSECHTEDRTKFRTLWQCRAQYEFFLNGLAFRGIGLTIAIFCAVCACLKSGGVTFGSHPEWELSASMSLRPGSAAVVAVSVLMASIWIFWFTEDRVRANARSYDWQLLEIGGEPHITVPRFDLPIETRNRRAREA